MQECLLDVDGILANFNDGFFRLHGLSNPYSQGKELGNYWLYPKEKYKSLGREFWANLEWMPDGREILKTVESVFGQKKICLLTNPSRCPDAAAGKMDWFHKHLPQYLDQSLIGAGKQFCSHPDRILIDDYDENIDNYPGKKILLPRPWNRNYPHNTMVFLEEKLKLLTRRNGNAHR